MELVQDLFLTTSLALILLFLVAKLVAMAIAGLESETEFGEGGDAGGEGVGAEEATYRARGERNTDSRAEEANRINQASFAGKEVGYKCTGENGNFEEPD
ncbi:hypothetical protein COP2_031014 [Malus domestica]